MSRPFVFQRKILLRKKMVALPMILILTPVELQASNSGQLVSVDLDKIFGVRVDLDTS